MAFSAVWGIGDNHLCGVSGGPLPWRRAPPLGLASSHSSDTLYACICMHVHVLEFVLPRVRRLILDYIVNPRVGVLYSSRFLVFVFFPRRDSSCSCSLLVVIPRDRDRL